MPVETIIVMVPVTKGTVAGFGGLKSPLAAKVAFATKAALTAKYPMLSERFGSTAMITTAQAKSALAGSGKMASYLAANQPAAGQATVATTEAVTVSPQGVTSLLATANNLVTQAQTLVDTVSTNIVPLVATVLGGAVGGVVGGGALQRQHNKKQQNLVESLSAQTKKQQAQVTKIESELTTTQAQVTQLTSEISKSAVPSETPQPAVSKEIAIDPSPAPAKPDDIEEIKGIGPVFAQRLNEAGIYTFADLLKLTPEQITDIVTKGERTYAIDAEDWLKQARTLAEMDD